jgi:hypothetical protein
MAMIHHTRYKEPREKWKNRDLQNEKWIEQKNALRFFNTYYPTSASGKY